MVEMEESCSQHSGDSGDRGIPLTEGERHQVYLCARLQLPCTSHYSFSF